MNLATQLAAVFDYHLLHNHRFQVFLIMPSLIFRLLLHRNIYMLLLNGHVRMITGALTLVLLLICQEIPRFCNNKFHIMVQPLFNLAMVNIFLSPTLVTWQYNLAHLLFNIIICMSFCSCIKLCYPFLNFLSR